MPDRPTVMSDVISDDINGRSPQDMLAGIMDSSLDALLLFEAVRDEDGELVDLRCMLANRKAEDLVGIDRKQLLGSRIRDEAPHLVKNGLFAEFQNVIDTGASFRSDWRFPELEGGWIEMSMVKCRDGVVLECRDITERKRTETALRESEQRFRLLAENVSDMVCLHDIDGTFLYVSPSSRNVLGYAPHEIEGKNSYQYIHPEDLERVRVGAHRQVLSEAEFAKVSYRVRRKDGAYIWVESTTKPIRDQDRRVYRMLTSSRDTTEQVQAEHELERLNDELEQRNRELQDFAYVASHDLQEPLRKVRAFADLMLEDYGSEVDDTGHYYLERMQDAASRMSGLISDLLEFSRITTQGRPFREVDLEQVARNVSSDLEIQVRDTDGTVRIGDLPTIEADPMQMRQLFQNLISNALKFHREDEPPVVELTAEPAPQVGNGHAAADGEYIVYVRDNGIGFEEKYSTRIFTPFQRLHGRDAYSGTGMGLAIARRIVERHQGEITVTSAAGEGTSFAIRLPARQPSNDSIDNGSE